MKYAITTAQTVRKRYVVEASSMSLAREIVLLPSTAYATAEETEPEIVDCTAFRKMRPRKERRAR